MTINKVIIIGNLGQDPEIRFKHKTAEKSLIFLLQQLKVGKINLVAKKKKEPSGIKYRYFLKA
jgi:single-stranded DNA-binding protein